MFAKDRDLVRLEPDLFSDVAWLAQRQLSLPSVTVSGGTVLTLEFFSFSVWGLAVGGVLLIDGRPVEIFDMPSQDAIVFSAVRGSDDDPLTPVHGLPPEAALDAYTFRPQIHAAHERVLGDLGLVPGATIGDGALVADRVTNPRDVARVESLGALAQIYAAAAPLPGAGSVIGAKAERYGASFERARRRLVVTIDLDGDGAADASRRVGALRLERT